MGVVEQVVQWLQLNWNWGYAVATLISLVGLVLSIWALKQGHRPKILDYVVITNVAILPSHAKGHTALAVTWEGEKLTDPRLVEVRIKNTGKRAVVASEYVAPIQVLYENGQPFDGFVQSASAARFKNMSYGDIFLDGYDRATSAIAIRPSLMNADDWFTLQLLSEGDPGRITVTSDFKDQARSMRQISNSRWTVSALLAVAASVASAAGGFVAAVIAFIAS